MSVRIEAQLAEVERELRARDHVYPLLIDKGRLRRDTAARHVEHMEAVRDTLQFIATHAAGLRALVGFLIRRADAGADHAPSETALETLMDHPGVAAVVSAFPGCSIAIGPPDITGQSDMFTDNPDAPEAHNDEVSA